MYLIIIIIRQSMQPSRVHGLITYTCRVEGPFWYPARHWRRRLVCSGVAGSVCGLRHGGPWHFAPTAENIIWSVWNGAGVVLVILGRPAPVCPDRIFSIYTDADSVWCTTGVSPWPHSVSFVHRRPYTDSSGSRSLPTSLRRRHTGVRLLPTVCVTGAAEHHH